MCFVEGKSVFDRSNKRIQWTTGFVCSLSLEIQVSPLPKVSKKAVQLCSFEAHRLLVTSSNALVTSSDASVTSSFLLLVASCY